MGPVAFLVIAVVVGVIGILALVGMNRAPRRPDFAMEEFRREMQALAPPGSKADQQKHSVDGRDTPGSSEDKRVGPNAGSEEA